jgi:TetR/AcrR family transcriptional regulator, cholesterol catabolism regulator
MLPDMASSKTSTSAVGSPDNRWDAVVAAAITVFDKKGYQAATVQDIATEAGIVKGTLYYYIKAKDDLLFEVMDSVQKQLVPMLNQIHDANSSATQKLHAFVKSYVRHTVNNRKAVGIFLKEFDSLSPKRRKKITESRDLYDKFVFDLLKEGRDAGEFADDIDLRVATFSIFGMVNWLYRWYRPGGDLSPDEIATMMADCAVRSVSKPG